MNTISNITRTPATLTQSDDVRAIARARLNTVIENGKASAGSVISRVLSTIPEDRIVSSTAVRGLMTKEGELRVSFGEKGELRGMHRHARRQLCDRLSIPNSYADDLCVAGEDSGWKRDLFGKMMREHLDHAGERYLMRTVEGQVRGVLSDKFRRLDGRPMLDAFVSACNSIGALPTEGVATDLRYSVRAIIPQIFEPIPGEFVVFGLSQTNSDFGAAGYSVSAFALRLVCLNGMVGENGIKQVHLGGRLPENIELSAETYRKDTATMVSATTDVVRALLAPAAIEKRINVIKAAAATEVNSAAMFKKIGALLTKGEKEAVKQAYEGDDVLMLPAGQTAYRFSNALSWVANSVKDEERKLDLQAAAGAIVAA
jgi:hypothetical protein